jgi:hypothetical protein
MNTETDPTMISIQVAELHHPYITIEVPATEVAAYRAAEARRESPDATDADFADTPLEVRVWSLFPGATVLEPILLP